MSCVPLDSYGFSGAIVLRKKLIVIELLAQVIKFGSNIKSGDCLTFDGAIDLPLPLNLIARAINLVML